MNLGQQSSQLSSIHGIKTSQSAVLPSIHGRILPSSTPQGKPPGRVARPESAKSGVLPRRGPPAERASLVHEKVPPPWIGPVWWHDRRRRLCLKDVLAWPERIERPDTDCNGKHGQNSRLQVALTAHDHHFSTANSAGVTS